MAAILQNRELEYTEVKTLSSGQIESLELMIECMGKMATIKVLSRFRIMSAISAKEVVDLLAEN